MQEQNVALLIAGFFFFLWGALIFKVIKTILFSQKKVFHHTREVLKAINNPGGALLKKTKLIEAFKKFEAQNAPKHHFTLEEIKPVIRFKLDMLKKYSTQQTSNPMAEDDRYRGFKIAAAIIALILYLGFALRNRIPELSEYALYGASLITPLIFPAVIFFVVIKQNHITKTPEAKEFLTRNYAHNFTNREITLAAQMLEKGAIHYDEAVQIYGDKVVLFHLAAQFFRKKNNYLIRTMSLFSLISKNKA